MQNSNKRSKKVNQEESNNRSVSINNHDISGLFQKDNKLFFLHKKSEKIAAALYLVTKNFPGDDPLRLKIRTLATDLIQRVNSLKSSTISESVSKEDVFSICREIVSNLEISFVSGMLSEMNVRIIQKETLNLLEEIKVYSKDQINKKIYKPNFFEVEEIDVMSQESPSKQKDFHTKDKIYISQTSQKEQNKPDIVKDKSDYSNEYEDSENNSYKTKDIESQSKDLSDFGPVAVKRSKRRSAIINLLKRKKEIMVKDIAAVVHDCSEKTLQRELGALVEEGVLNKEGERRWTKYSLA